MNEQQEIRARIAQAYGRPARPVPKPWGWADPRENLATGAADETPVASISAPTDVKPKLPRLNKRAFVAIAVGAAAALILWTGARFSEGYSLGAAEADACNAVPAIIHQC